MSSMFSPAVYARYQSAVQDSDSPTLKLGRHSSEFSAKLDDRVNACASAGCAEPSRSQPGFPANRALNASTTSRTEQKDAGSGPKLTARGAVADVSTRACANAR